MDVLDVGYFREVEGVEHLNRVLIFECMNIEHAHVIGELF